MGIDVSKAASRIRSVLQTRRNKFRRMVCENLERRELMAVDGPRLLSIAPNSGEILSTTRENRTNESPRELTFRFDSDLSTSAPTSMLTNGIRITRTGGAPVTPFFDFGESSRIVIARFVDPLPDDLYTIEVNSAILDSTGRPLTSPDGTGRVSFQLNLELGTKIIAVVPQPINSSARPLTQAKNQIDIYFNDGELFDANITVDMSAPPAVIPPVVDPQFYALILTKDSVSPNDDVVFRPNRLEYVAIQRKLTLTFPSDLDVLDPTPGPKTYRLRVGSNDPITSVANQSTIVPITLANDPVGTLAGIVGAPTDLGNQGGSFSRVFDQELRVVSSQLPNNFPGSNFEPGHRDIQDESHQEGGPDSNPEITTIFYSFMEGGQSYGVDRFGRPLFTAISPEQKQRVREVFEFYSVQLGVDFSEYLGNVATADPSTPRILQVVVGDMFPNGVASGPGDVIGVAGGNLAIMDGAERWDNSFGYGSAIPGTIPFFDTAMHEIGHLLGLGHTYEQPPGTIMGNTGNLASNPLEQIFPGDVDRIHGQHLFRLDNRDVDLYRFVINPGVSGEIKIETIAERLAQSSNADTHLTLLKKEANGLRIVAANNNYFSEDSFLKLNLDAGEYFVAVTGKGNENANPEIIDSGSGATSQGNYRLLIDFKSNAGRNIAEARQGSTDFGTNLDGDGDGLPSGNFDFWFRVGSDVSHVPGRTTPGVLFVDKASTASISNGAILTPFKNIKDATAAAIAGDIIRVVGDLRPSALLNPASILPYSIGNDATTGNLELPDGASLTVPRGVTLMIDEGAVFKMGGSRVLVGSNDSTTDRNGAAIQVLGTPRRPVFFTSYLDRSLGTPSSPSLVPAAPGNWGGIEIHNDFDRSQGRTDSEREGIFLNTISNADIKFGGGTVGQGSLARVVTPVDLSEARPLILQNRFSLNSGAALSADPDSFEETLFTESRYQLSGLYSPDYSRVGPIMRGNNLVNNSINGMLVRVETISAIGLKPQTVSARWDDAEMPIVLAESLILGGTPGGSTVETIGPSVNLVSPTLINNAPGIGFTVSQAGPLSYVITYVDRYGQESLPSTIIPVVVAANQSVLLTNLPPATLDYVSKRIYRRVGAEFRLIGSVGADITSFLDTGTSTNRVLQQSVPGPETSAVVLSIAQPSVGLGFVVPNTVGYVFTFVDNLGVETRPSAVLSQLVATGDAVQLNNLPTSAFAIRIYRQSSSTDSFFLVTQLPAGTTSFLDNGGGPDVTQVISTNTATPIRGTGFDVSQQQQYVVTFVDGLGTESLPSTIIFVDSVAGNAIRLTGLPVLPATTAFEKRIYRRTNTPSGPQFHLVGTVPFDFDSFQDDGPGPDLTNVTASIVPVVGAAGFASTGQVVYMMTYVDALGNEGPHSTQFFTNATAGSAVELNGLPIPLPSQGYVQKSIYRQIASGDFRLVDTIPVGDTTYVDRGAPLSIPFAGAFFDIGMAIGGVKDYVLTYVDGLGNETTSTPIIPVNTAANDQVIFFDLPVTNNFVSKRIYRRDGAGQPFQRIGEVTGATTFFIDTFGKPDVSGVVAFVDNPTAGAGFASPAAAPTPETYRFTYSNSPLAGSAESTPSDPVTVNSVTGEAILLNGLPTTSDFNFINIYRLIGTEFRRVGQVTAATTSFLDNWKSPRVATVGLAATPPTAGGGHGRTGAKTYRITHVDAFGQETLASDERSFNSTTLGQTVTLTNLPVGTGFVSTNIYREVTPNSNSFRLVGTIPTGTTTFVDNWLAPPTTGVTATELAPNPAPPVGSPGLPAGQYQYRFSWVRPTGEETLPSDVINATVATNNGLVRLAGLPNAGAGSFAGGSLRIYRAAVTGPVVGAFEMVGRIPMGTNFFTDQGGIIANPNSGGTAAVAGGGFTAAATHAYVLTQTVLGVEVPIFSGTQAINANESIRVTTTVTSGIKNVYRFDPTAPAAFKFVGTIADGSGAFLDGGAPFGANMSLPMAPQIITELARQTTTMVATDARLRQAILQESNILDANAVTQSILMTNVLVNPSVFIQPLQTFAFPVIPNLILQQSLLNQTNLTQTPLTPTSLRRARRDASLVIDPGMVIKSLGGRIEVGIGSTLLAEGSQSKPIVFTSRRDDRFGGSGSFDTNNDGSSTGSPGDWGGIISRHLGELSIDSALITFAGGTTSIPGGAAAFNPIEIHQSTARIANSTIENNASGLSTPASTSNRATRGLNDASAIFILGSQPVIVNNRIRNSSAAMSIDANSLNALRVTDWGRSIGNNDRQQSSAGNSGPFIKSNLFGGNAINGLRVRGATLTTESVWDDTDIVHVVQSEIVVPDFHTYGGLRLASKVDESLVVKFGPTGGITALGRPLDIKDRIGGTLQIIGTPGFPVVMTGLQDDTIGAGFSFSGGSLTDTDNTLNSTATPGSWRSILFQPFANDRNVALYTERESDRPGATGVNNFPAFAQDLGQLAPNLKDGDENLRYGFTVSGSIAAKSDIDVYRFTGTAGKAVWIEIDQSQGNLDTVIELIDINGNILALSDNSIEESAAGAIVFQDQAAVPGGARPMDQSIFENRNANAPSTQVDFQGINPLDAGFRVVLPGVLNSVNTYFVRVRSSNRTALTPSPQRLTDPGLINDGASLGGYKLHVRLQQKQEVAGSTVRFADIRFATIGIDVRGMPMHSPLLGEIAEPDQNENVQRSLLDIGNILTNDRGAISIAGTLTDAAVPDVDEYRFHINRDSVQGTSLAAGGRHQSVVFDLDYADGLGRADTQLFLYREETNGNLTLIASANDSNIADDQPAALFGTHQEDLTRGSLGKRDAFLGPIELPPGNYRVQVVSRALVPAILQTNTNIRLEPVESVRRLVESRFPFTASPISERPSTADGPLMQGFGVVGEIFSEAIPNPAAVDFGTPNAVPFNLSDVTLFAVGPHENGGNVSQVNFVNPFTGAKEAHFSTTGGGPAAFNGTYFDIAFNPAGQGYGFQIPGGVITNANSGQFVPLDIGNGAPGGGGTTGLAPVHTYIPPGGTAFVVAPAINNGGQNGHGMLMEALTYSNVFNGLSFWGVGRRAGGIPFQQAIVDGNNAPIGQFGAGMSRNILYRLDPATGAAINPNGVQSRPADGRQSWGAGTTIVEHGYFVRDAGLITLDGFGRVTKLPGSEANGTVSGVASIGGRMIAVTNQGEIMGMTPNPDGGQVFSDTYFEIRDPATNLLIPFTGLTAGPRNVENGAFANILFGMSVSADGATRLWAFNEFGVLQPIFPGGRSFTEVPTTDLNTVGSSVGIDFAALDVNLWHHSRSQANAAGHGRPENYNNSRNELIGDGSLRFAYVETTNGNGFPEGMWEGAYGLPANLRGTYSMGGGAMGALESDLLDLREIAADDQPVMYFNYQLNTQDSNSQLGDETATAALDMFRVYGAGDDGQWVLLATNNSRVQPRNADFFSRVGNFSDEFDVPNSGNQDAFGRSSVTTELADNAGWRQARVNLAPLAGKRDVRIRFEFSTSGDFRSQDPRRGGIEFSAVPGARLKPRDTFLINNSAGAVRFEFDMGVVLNLPSGRSLATGNQIQIGLDVFTFDNAPGAFNIPFNVTDTPAQIASSVKSVLERNGFTVFTHGVDDSTIPPTISEDATPGVLNVVERFGNRLDSTEVYQVIGADANIVIGRPVAETPVLRRVLVDNRMTGLEVRDAIREALAARYNVAGEEDNIDVYKVKGLTIALHSALSENVSIVQSRGGVTPTASTTGPLVISSRRSGDNFGALDNRLFYLSRNYSQAGLRTQTNLADIHIDDIVIGFAERGEVILNNPTFNGFAPTQFYQQVGARDGRPNSEELRTGAYQLEIRTAADYGETERNPTSTIANPLIELRLENGRGRTFDTNDRLAKRLFLEISDAAGVRDRDTFTLSNGVQTVVYEFDVVTSSLDTAVGTLSGNIPVRVSPNATTIELARAIRDAINSIPSFGILGYSASTDGDMLGSILTGARSNRIYLSAENAALDVAGSLQSSGVPWMVLGGDGLDTGFGEDLGDSNVVREQGQFIIDSATVRRSSGVGINIDAAARDQSNLAPSANVGQRPYPGAVRNLITLNASNIASGPVVMNSVLSRNNGGGIAVSGDTGTVNGISPMTVARIVNNTFVGNSAGIGINVNQGVTATIINNIITDFQTGISGTTSLVLNSNIYHRNQTDKPVNIAEPGGINLDSLPSNPDPLFIPNGRVDERYYLVAQSQAIDSSVASNEDRSALDQVKDPFRIATSPILAPLFDNNGLLRQDDPGFTSPLGPFFIDRGAIDRVDFSGPVATLTRPIDDDTDLVDGDRNRTYLKLTSGTYNYFEILLDENGTGVDSTTVTQEKVILTENGRTLIHGSDYVFGYSLNSRAIRLTPLGGFWRSDSVYEITLINRPSIRLDVPNGSQITDGQRVLVNLGTTLLTFEFDSNGSVVPSATLIPIPFTSATTSAEIVGRFYAALRGRSGLSIDVLSGSTMILFGATSVTSPFSSLSIDPIRDLASNNLTANRTNLLTQFTIAMPEALRDFGDAIERSGTGFVSNTFLNAPPPGSPIPTVNAVRHALYPIDVPQIFLGQFVDPDDNGTPSGAADSDDIDSSVSFSANLPFTLQEQGPYNLVLSPKGPGLVNSTITMLDDLNNTVVFRFADNTTTVGATEIAINVQSANTADEVASALQQAVFNQAILTGRLWNIVAINTGNRVQLGGTVNHRLTISAAARPFVKHDAVGAVTINVVNPGIVLNGETVTIRDGSGNTVVFQIIDTSVANPSPLLPGNLPLRINLATSTAAQLAQGLQTAINDAIRARRLNLPILQPSSLTGSDLRLSFDDEDGVRFAGFFNERAVPVQVSVDVSGPGYLSVFFDWNRDNSFDGPNELAVATVGSTSNVRLENIPVTAGTFQFSISTPVGASVGYSTARFRLSTTPTLLTTGMALGGEVEDHLIEILGGAPPVSSNDPSGAAGEYRVVEDTVLRVPAAFGVLQNDVSNDTLILVHDFVPFPSPPAVGVVDPVIGPTNGTLVLRSDGSFDYTPNPDFFGRDTFVYMSRNRRMTSNEATVTINVLPQNDDPVATNDNTTLDEDNRDFAAAPNGSILWPATFFTNTLSFDQRGGAAPFENNIQNFRLTNAAIISSAVGGTVSVTGNNEVDFRPSPHYNSNISGDVLIQLTLQDDGTTGSVATLGSGLQDFATELARALPNVVADPKVTTSVVTVAITPLNDRPTFDVNLVNSTITRLEDAGPFSQPVITNVDPGGGSDEDSQTVPNFRVTVRANHPNPTSLFSVQPVVVGAANSATRTLEFTLAPDVNSIIAGGNIILEVIAVDDGPNAPAGNFNESLVRQITVSITPVNDAPEFEILFSTLTIEEDAPLQFFSQFFFDDQPGPDTATDEAGQDVVSFAVSIPAGAASLYSVAPRLNNNGDLEFQYGTDVNSDFALANPTLFDIYISGTDDGTPAATGIRTLSVTVTPINDQPFFAIPRTRVDIIEDQGTYNEDGFVTGLRQALNLDANGQMTALDELVQTYLFDISFSNPNLYQVPPTIDPNNGRLSFRTAVDQNGNSVVTVRLRDSGLASPAPNNNLGPLLTFTVSVQAINDAPEFDIPATLNVVEDQGVVSIPGFATGIRPGPATAVDENRQTLSFSLLNPNDYADTFEVLPSIQPDGTLTFRTKLDVNSNTIGINPVVTFQLTDSGSNVFPNRNTSVIRTVTLSISPVNDPPIPGSFTANATEDITLDMTTNAVLGVIQAGPPDESAQTIAITAIERSSDRSGSITPVIVNDIVVSFRYVPPVNFAGRDFVRYVVTDDGTPPRSATGTITIDVAPVNDAPQFVAGSDLSVNEDAPAFSQPWATAIAPGPANAPDEATQSVSFEVATNNPSFFAVQPSVSPQGVLSFTLAKDVNGSVTLDITAVDSGPSNGLNVNRSSTHRMTIVVRPVNDAPGFVLGQNINIDEDSGAFDRAGFVTRIVPAEGMNDSPATGGDETGQTVSFTVTNNRNAVFAVQPTIDVSGRLQFTPAANAFGNVEIYVVATDNGPSSPPNVNASSRRTFTVSIRQINDVPFSVNDRYSIDEDSLLSVTAPGVIANDLDPDLPDDQLSIVIASNTFQSTFGATVTLNADGSFSYDPRTSARLQGLTTNQVDVDTFTYTIRDRVGETSNLGTASITVTGINDAPVAANDTIAIAAGVPVTIAVLDNDRDVDTPINVGTLTIGQLPTNGSVIVSPSGRVEYRPNSGFIGQDTFTYRVRDSLNALSNEATVTIRAGSAPVAANDSAITSIDRFVDIDVLRNDVASGGTIDPSSLVIETQPDVGTVSILPNALIRYTPRTGFIGTASFQYSVKDTNGISSNVGTVTVRVIGSIHQNPLNRLDVNDDTFVSALDVLVLINDLNKRGSRELPVNQPRPPYLDVNGDGVVNSLDVLEVRNFLNARARRGGSGSTGGEGEGEAMEQLGWSETVEIMSPQRYAELRSQHEDQLQAQLDDSSADSFAIALEDDFAFGPVPLDLDEDEGESLEDYLAVLSSQELEIGPKVLDKIFSDDWS